MFDYLIITALVLLTIGVVVLFVQIMRLAWHVKTVDTVVIKLIQGEKITLRRVDGSPD